MNMTDRDPLLDDLFAEARSDAPSMSNDFMARIMADAERLQPKGPAIAAQPPQAAQRGLGFWHRVAAALGGAVAIFGISSAAMAGLVIGYVQPESVVNLADGLGFAVTTQSVDILPGFDSLLVAQE